MNANKKGLIANQDDAIYIRNDGLEKEKWDVFRTKIGGHCATQLFTFGTRGTAALAGLRIAVAIGGKFYGSKDPRNLKAKR